MPTGSGPFLTKSRFVRGRDCVRRAWLDAHRPDLRPPLSGGAEDRIRTGGRIGELARLRYPAGRLVPETYGDVAKAADLTHGAIAEGRSCLFEATVAAGDSAARLDVLMQTTTGWAIHEVKSSSLKPIENLRPDLVEELAFEVLTARRAGLTITEARLVLVDTGYRWPGGEFDPDAMLGSVDLTDRCDELAEEIAACTDAIRKALGARKPPAVETNVHCKHCDYFAHCVGPCEPDDLLFLHRARAPLVAELRSLGIRRIGDIPEDHPLSEPQARQRDACALGRPVVKEGLANALTAVPFPAAFLDFETTNPAFPFLVGTRPYAQTCFQWSCHSLTSPEATPVHREFLAGATGDPRGPFCESLWEAIRKAKAIVHYTAFEVERVRDLAEDGIPLADRILEAIEARSVDLHAIVAEHVTMREFAGRTSIKVVLPALVPTMTYAGMTIADGEAAALAYRRLRDEATTPEEARQIRRALLAYCRQDTLAMVAIYRALRRLAGAGAPT